MTARRRFKPYPAYKNSGVEWMGEIPADWDVKPWRYCCRVTEGQVAPDDDRFRDRIMIAPNHIESGTGRILFTETANEQGAISGKYLVKPGDIIYSKIRPALNKACIATGDWLCSADMYPVAITEKRLDARYLLYFILAEPFVRLMIDESMRVAMPKVNRETLAACPLVIPGPEAQHAIGAFLDRETARIDALLAKKERLIALLQEQRTALITRAVTKGLDPGVPMKDSGAEWLGKVPAHWEVKRIKLVARMVSGHTPDKKVESYWKGGDIPWVSLADTAQLREVDYIASTAVLTTSEGIAHSSAHVLPEGTVVFSRDATIGLCAITRGGVAVSQHFIGWVCGPRLRPEYLLLILRSMAKELERLTMGATVRTIGMPDVKSLVTPIPPLAEQEEIVRGVLNRRERLDALIAKVRDAIDRLKELRTALISAAVTGKIDVREEVA